MDKWDRNPIFFPLFFFQNNRRIWGHFCSFYSYVKAKNKQTKSKVPKISYKSKRDLQNLKGHVFPYFKTQLECKNLSEISSKRYLKFSQSKTHRI